MVRFVKELVVDVEQDAREFAVAAHGDQKYGGKPYVTHLEAVRAVLKDFGFDGDYGVAAWLHDVLEDTKTSLADLEHRFGSPVTCLVYAVTGVGKNRKERNECAYLRMAANPGAIILKLADRIANSEDSVKSNPKLLEMYRKEYPKFKDRLAPLCSSNPQVALMWERLDKVHSSFLIGDSLGSRRDMMTVTVSKKLAPIPVTSYAEASRVVREYISANGMGGTEWYRNLPFTKTARGAAIHVDGVQVAFVSYNGRVWKGVENMKLGHEEIPV
jgi:hypothetical protein